jgi:hypothetical protein
MSSCDHESKASFSGLTVKQLHPNFDAEIEGVNFARLSEEQFSDILAATAEVCGFPVGRMSVS